MNHKSKKSHKILRVLIFTRLLLLFPFLASCRSERLSPEQTTMIKGIQEIYALHRPITENDITKAFGTDFSKYEKTCEVKWANSCNYHLPDYEPTTDQLLILVAIDKFVGIQASPPQNVQGWVGEQIQMSFDKKYCLTADDFKEASHLDYSRVPAHRLIENGGGVSWPPQLVFKEPQNGNTLTFDEGCRWYVIQQTYFDTPLQ